MRIEKREDKEVVVFEEADKEIQDQFLELMNEQGELRKAVEVAIEEYERSLDKVKIATKRLDLWRLENHDRVWNPINDKLKETLGDVPDLSFDCKSRELVREEERRVKEEKDVDFIVEMLKSIGGKVVPVRVYLQQEEDDDDLVRH